MIYYPDILQQYVPASRFTYSDNDIMLYAVALGYGYNPLDVDELPFVDERMLKIVPTVATVLASRERTPASQVPLGLRLSDYNFAKVLHAGQRVELHRPLPTSGSFSASSKILSVHDKGADKGAVIVKQTQWVEDDAPIVTLTSTIFARADGGCGGDVTPLAEPISMPSRRPDASVSYSTWPNQALIYRLTGDRNPLHSAPEVAGRAGFSRPILHGLCVYGITCRAVIETMLGFNPDLIKSHEARFSAPVFPGDTITVHLWLEDNTVLFEANVAERDVVVIRSGQTQLHQLPPLLTNGHKGAYSHV